MGFFWLLQFTRQFSISKSKSPVFYKKKYKKHPRCSFKNGESEFRFAGYSRFKDQGQRASEALMIAFFFELSYLYLVYVYILNVHNIIHHIYIYVHIYILYTCFSVQLSGIQKIAYVVSCFSSIYFQKRQSCRYYRESLQEKDKIRRALLRNNQEGARWFFVS